MKIVAIGAEKGGAGKTTTTLYLATRAADRLRCPDGRPRVAIVDRDTPRQLTKEWTARPHIRRDDILLMPDGTLPSANSGIEVVLIDTPPGRDALPSLEDAHTIVIPCPTTDLGVNALPTYIRRVEERIVTLAPHMRLVAIVPTQFKPRALSHQDHLEDIKDIAARHQPPLLVLPAIQDRVRVQELRMSAPDYDAAAEELFRHATL